MLRDQSWRAVVAAFILNGLLFGAWASRVPAFKEHYDLDPSSLSWLLLALAFGAIISFPFAGLLSERWGPKRLTIYCSWAYLPALFALSCTSSVFALGLCLFLFGAFHGAMDVAMNGWGARVEKNLKRNTMSIFHAMFSLGASLGAASGYIAVSMSWNPTWHFFIMAGIGGLITIRFIALHPLFKEPVSHTKRPAFLVIPTGRLLLIGLIAFAASMGEGAVADWSAVFLQLVTSASEAQAALGYAIFGASMVVTRLLGGLIIENFGSVTSVRLSASAAFIGIFMCIFGGSTLIAVSGFALMGAGYAIVMPVVFSWAANDRKVSAGAAIAGVATLGYGGMLLGPPVIGFAAQIVGMQFSFLILLALALLMIVIAPQLGTKK